MKLTYSLSVIDELGNIVVDHPLTADEAVQILAPYITRKDPEPEQTPVQSAPTKRKKEVAPATRTDKGRTGRKGDGSVAERNKNLLADLAKGMKPADAAEKYNMPVGSVYQIKSKAKYQNAEPTPALSRPAPAERPPLDRDQYDQLRAAMHDRDFSSAAYALTNKLAPYEVNTAIRSSDYEDYLAVRNS